MIDNIVKAFESQVDKTPDLTAVEFAQKTMTYSELNDKANSIAKYLITEKTIGSGDIVPLLLSRNENIVIAMLAVLKTGAAYTALSLQYPESRINFADCKIKLDN